MNALTNSRILVTGAGGFIGSNLVDRLVREGARVRGLCRYNSRADRGALEWLDPEVVAAVEIIMGDLRDIESVTDATADTDTVIHLGAQVAVPYSYTNPRDFVECNVTGTLNVAQAALAAGVKTLVHVSSSEVYGSARQVPITEEHPLQPQSPYAATKLGGEKLIVSFQKSFDLPAVIVRPFNTYGPHQSARALIPTVLTQALTGNPVKLGALHPTRDLLFVDDTVVGLLAAAQSPEAIGRTVALGTGRETSVADVVEVVGEVLGRTLEVEVEDTRLRPPASEVDRLVCDPLLAGELFQWRATTTLEEGLAITAAWFADRLDRTRVGEYMT